MKNKPKLDEKQMLRLYEVNTIALVANITVIGVMLILNFPKYMSNETSAIDPSALVCIISATIAAQQLADYRHTKKAIGLVLGIFAVIIMLWCGLDLYQQGAVL
ncbi:MAG: hypothetical protein ATN35_03870 [Epulopiscium sp. Nele67-Bin004]|nr:MAG: hypothetical protein ATN35_03870 [Epulopiscium sp. Nele67-Bin004]